MAARTETGDAAAHTTVGARGSGWRGRAWRYGPLAAWVCFVLYSSTGAMASSNTSRVFVPLLRRLLPGLGEPALHAAHLAVRKSAHFAEYAALALLAARAFLPSSRPLLRRRWLFASLLLVVAVALADELNQSRNPTRVGALSDSLLDTAGGLTALAALAYARGRRERREVRFRRCGAS